MALNQCLSADFDIKSPAARFFYSCIETMKLPKDNVTVEIEDVPLEKKKTSYKIEGFQISELYDLVERDGMAKWENLEGFKKLEGIMTITHMDDRTHATLTLKYEKINSDIEEPKSILKTFVEFVTYLDEFMVSLKSIP